MRVGVPRGGVGGWVRRSERKNPKEEPSQIIVQTGGSPALESMKSQAKEFFVSKSACYISEGKGTVSFSNDPCNRAEALFVTANAKRGFNKENSRTAADFELVFDTTASGKAT